MIENVVKHFFVGRNSHDTYTNLRIYILRENEIKRTTGKEPLFGWRTYICECKEEETGQQKEGYTRSVCYWHITHTRIAHIFSEFMVVYRRNGAGFRQTPPISLYCSTCYTLASYKRTKRVSQCYRMCIYSSTTAAVWIISFAYVSVPIRFV